MRDSEIKVKAIAKELRLSSELGLIIFVKLWSLY